MCRDEQPGLRDARRVRLLVAVVLDAELADSLVLAIEEIAAPCSLHVASVAFDAIGRVTPIGPVGAVALGEGRFVGRLVVIQASKVDERIERDLLRLGGADTDRAARIGAATIGGNDPRQDQQERRDARQHERTSGPTNEPSIG
ncbi:MAG: hypothetical protein KDC46_10820 [Thermoleophilia bacterium]|nr:hypothetical protein [Thermoleophilia bacterium]